MNKYIKRGEKPIGEAFFEPGTKDERIVVIGADVKTTDICLIELADASEV